MPTSNSVYFAVRPDPTYDIQESGWSVQVLDYTTFDQVVAVIGEFAELQVSPELSATGQGSITLDLDHPFWSMPLADGVTPAADLIEHEYLWRCFQDGVERFEFLGSSVEQHLVETDNTRTVTISGPGSAQVLSWGCILPDYFPPASNSINSDPQDPTALTPVWPRFPTNWPAMRIWLNLLRRAQGRGTIGYVFPTFNETTDSSGADWEVVYTPGEVADLSNPIVPDPGTNLLDLLNIHTGQDLEKQFAERTEWLMRPGFQLDVRKTIGSHRETEVVFFEGQTIGKERTRTRENIANYVVTVDAIGNTSFATDTSSIRAWQQREQLQNSNQQVTDPARRDAITGVYLDLHKDEVDEWTLTVPYDTPGRKAFVDYGIGDWISVTTFKADGSNSNDIYRVIGMTVDVTDDGTTLELTLRTRLTEVQRALQIQLTNILNTVGSMQADPISLNSAPADGQAAGWSPTVGDYTLPYDSVPGGGGGGSSGCSTCVFIQPVDPGSAAKPGDFWYDTSNGTL